MVGGAAFGWSAAIVLTNLLPLAQVAVSVRLHPFGRGTLISAVLCAFSFGLLPFAARELLGPGVIPALLATGAGAAILAAGMWRFRKDLNLAAMPGAVQLRARFSNRNSTGPHLGCR